MTPPNDPTTPAAAPDPGASYARHLLHRWFIEYNPLYLLSAALVLTGTSLCARGLAQGASVHGPLGVAGIAELYAACLIGGAALLMRIGQRRPAVMLALLTILYQWDLTLHTERSPYLGSWAAAAWVVVFVAKLHGLTWAMKVRLSRGATAAATLAGIGLAFFPVYLDQLAPRAAGTLVALWVFALASLRPSSTVTSLVPLEGWAATVLQRMTRAAWILSAVLVSGHVLFWSSQWSIHLSMLFPVAPLLFVRRVRSEERVWVLVLGTLVFVGLTMPALFSLTAFLAAGALALRALSPSVVTVQSPAPAAARPEPPYRAAVADPPPAAPEIPVAVPMTVDPAAVKRLLAGAVFATYLSVWTLGWTGGAWPAHILALDVALALVVIGAVWRARMWAGLAPLLASALHLVLQMGLVPAPRSLVEWGASSVVLGFALLAGSLAVSYRLRAPAR